MPVFLQELFTVKEASEDVLPIKEPEENIYLWTAGERVAVM